MRSYTFRTPPSSAPSNAWPSFKTSAWGLISFLIMLEGVRIQTYFSPFTAGILLLLSEEAHLGQDIAYRKYVEYMKEYSLYARFMKFLRTRVAVA